MDQHSICKQQGAAAIELAIVLIFLILALAGIIEFGRAFWYYDALSKATRDGARMLSMADKVSFSTGSHISDAKSLVVNSANAARLSPALQADQVVVTCLSDTFGTIPCGSGIGAPANVRVAIENYVIDLGGWVPFLSPSGSSSSYPGVPLAPSTTMRYMN